MGLKLQRWTYTYIYIYIARKQVNIANQLSSNQLVKIFHPCLYRRSECGRLSLKVEAAAARLRAEPQPPAQVKAMIEERKESLGKVGEKCPAGA